MSLRYMKVELGGEPRDIIHWVCFARISLGHLLPTRRTPGRDGNTVLVIIASASLLTGSAAYLECTGAGGVSGQVTGYAVVRQFLASQSATTLPRSGKTSTHLIVITITGFRHARKGQDRRGACPLPGARRWADQRGTLQLAMLK